MEIELTSQENPFAPKPEVPNTPPAEKRAESDKIDLETELSRLETLNENLDRENLELIGKLIGSYNKIWKSLPADKSAKVEERVQELLALKKKIKERKSANETEDKQETAIAELVAQLERRTAIPEADKRAFLDHLSEILRLISESADPAALEYANNLRQRFFLHRLKSALNTTDEAGMLTQLQGMDFELTRFLSLYKQNQENFSFSQAPVKVTYEAYSKKPGSSEIAATRHVEDSEIEPDVPLWRDNSAFVYEAKSYPRRLFGSDNQARDQVLKLQAAIDQGKISGATIEVTGRIDLNFLAWYIGESISDQGAGRDVELIYSLPLPSGREYRLPLNSPRKRIGLKYDNAQDYTEEDMAVIRGAERSLSDKSIIGIISGVKVEPEDVKKEFEGYFNFDLTPENLPKILRRTIGFDTADPEKAAKIITKFFGMTKKPELKRLAQEIKDRGADTVFFERFYAARENEPPSDAATIARDIWKDCFTDPGHIGSAELFKLYERLRRQTVQTELAGKQGLVNKSNERGSLSKFATPDFVKQSILRFKEYLDHNPRVRAAKADYDVAPDKIDAVVERTMNVVGKVRSYESARLADPAEAQRQAERQSLGYAGPLEGVALDMDHFWMDAAYGAKFEESGPNLGGVKNQEFFVEKSGGRLKLKHLSIADFQAALGHDLKLAKSFYALEPGKRDSVLDSLRAAIKRNEFTRNYEWPERFVRAEDMTGYLEGQDRRYHEVAIHDPAPGFLELQDVHDEPSKPEATVRHCGLAEEKIQNTRHGMTAENIRRAIHFLKLHGHKLMGENAARAKRINTRLDEIEVEKKMELAKIQDDINRRQTQVGPDGKTDRQRENDLKKRRKDLASKIKQTVDFPSLEGVQKELDQVDAELDVIYREQRSQYEQIQTKSRSYTEEVQSLTQELEGVYRDAMSKKNWIGFAQREVDEKDQNMMKMIYAVTAEGEIMLQEEIFRGSVTGRAAHSELARGRNVYGAGELVLNKVRQTLPDGRTMERWRVGEINNGSGHFRPDADSTLAYVRNLLQKKFDTLAADWVAQGRSPDDSPLDFEVAEDVTFDCILRGRKLKNASLI